MSAHEAAILLGWQVLRRGADACDDCGVDVSTPLWLVATKPGPTNQVRTSCEGCLVRRAEARQREAQQQPREEALVKA